MPDQAPEVKVKLTGEDTGVAAAIKALGSQLKDLKDQSKDTAGGLGELKGAFDKLIGAEVIFKLVEFGKEVFEASVNVERMSQKTGLSAGLLSTFAKAAESSGLSSEQMNTSLGRLATNITKFQEGASKASSSFKALNLTQSDFKGLSSDEKVKLVTDRLGAMENGLQKASIAQQLMGRGGQALIPTLNALAGDGFDEVTKAAQRSGQYLSDGMAADAASAAASFAELEGAGKGIATQFEAGLLPALNDVADALTNQIEDGGVSSFQTLGKEAGTVVKTLVLAWQIGANTISAILLTLYDSVASQFKQFGNVVETLGEAALDAGRGRFADAGKAIANGFHNGIKLAGDSVDDLKSRWTSLADVVTKGSLSLFPSDPDARQKGRRDKFKRNGDGSDDDPAANDAKANKARLTALEQRLQEEGALFKANNAQQESENQIAYTKGLESLKAYFAKRKQLAQDEANEQISVLTRERDAVAKSPTDGTDAGAIAKKAQIAKFDNEIAVAKVTAATKQKQLDQELFTAEEAHQKTLLGYQAEILAAQGLTYEAALVKIQSEESEIRRSLVQAGLTPSAVDAMVAKIQQLKTATAAFDEDKKSGDEALKDLAAARDDINLRVTAGLETQYGAEQKIAQLELTRVPELQKIAAAMRAAAITPDQVREADDFARHVRGIQVSAQAAQLSMQQFGKQAGTAIAGDLRTFLTSTIMQVHGVGDAFKQLAGSVVGSIQQIVAQLIIQIAMQKLLKASMSGGFSLGGLVPSGAGHAEGGYISGPGTATSDSIPARLSNGEFVMSAKAVRAIGADTLATMNRGVRIPSINGLSVPRFAEGGLVQTGTGSNGVDLHVGLDLAEGLVLKHLSSKQAGKIVLSHVGSNPKAVQKAIQRGA